MLCRINHHSLVSIIIFAWAERAIQVDPSHDDAAQKSAISESQTDSLS